MNLDSDDLGTYLERLLSGMWIPVSEVETGWLKANAQDGMGTGELSLGHDRRTWFASQLFRTEVGDLGQIISCL